MPYADADGFKLHYRLEGDASHPVVALSNSLGADLSMWDAQMEDLLPSFRVLRYDTRGHGKSEIPSGPCTLGTLGQDVVTLLDVLGIEKAHICGVSLGGLTAMWIGLHAPHRLRSLVLSNTAAKIGTADTWKERIATVEAHGLASIADSVISRWFTPQLQHRDQVFAAQRAMFLGCSTAGYLAASAALRDTDLRATVHALVAPTLVISGANDPVTPASDGHFLGAAIPGAIFHEVPGAHLSSIEEPAAYNRVLLSFLRQHSNSEDFR